MPDTLEVKESPLSEEQIQRDYVDIKGVAQIFGNVCEKTARKRLRQAKTKGFKVQSFEGVFNGSLGIRYLKADVITAARVLNKVPSVVSYEAVTVEPTVSLGKLPSAPLTEPLSQHFPAVPRVTVTRIVRGTVILNALISLSLILTVAYFSIVSQEKLKSQIKDLKSEIMLRDLIVRIGDEQKNFIS